MPITFDRDQIYSHLADQLFHLAFGQNTDISEHRNSKALGAYDWVIGIKIKSFSGCTNVSWHVYTGLFIYQCNHWNNAFHSWIHWTLVDGEVWLKLQGRYMYYISKIIYKCVVTGQLWSFRITVNDISWIDWNLQNYWWCFRYHVCSTLSFIIYL